MTLQEIILANTVDRLNSKVFVEVDVSIIQSKLNKQDDTIIRAFRNCKGYYYLTKDSNNLKFIYLHKWYKKREDNSRRILQSRFGLIFSKDYSVNSFKLSQNTFLLGNIKYYIKYCSKHNIYSYSRDKNSISCDICLKENRSQWSKQAKETSIKNNSDRGFINNPRSISKRKKSINSLSTEDKSKLFKIEETAIKNYQRAKEKYSSDFPEDVEILEQYKGFWTKEKVRKIYKFKCKKCNQDFSAPLDRVICRRCNPYYFKSESYFSNLVGGVKYRDKHEIDSYLENLKLGYEFNGVYFHAINTVYGKKDKKYHQNKSLYFAEKDIKLIHIWEDQFNNKRDLIISMINNQKGKSTKIYARKTELREITSKEAKLFLDENHLQGGKYSKYNFGLFFDDQLVQVFTINKHKIYQYEIDRFATLQNYVVIGGFSRLLKFFEKNFNPKTIMTYSSIDLNNIYQDSVYYKNGFKFLGITDPSYFYVNRKLNRYSRNKFQKHKLKKLFPDVYSNDMTETEIMTKVGYFKIYDSGNFKFLKEYNVTKK